jgi:undecaprenyl diphosphate synthase
MELLAFWSGSEDNLTKRPGDEVAILQEIYSRFLQRLASCMDKSDKRDVRFLHIGRSDRFSPEISRLIREIAKHTRNREGLKVVLALDYGGREDRWQAIRAYAQQWWKPWEWGKSWLDYTYLGQQGVSAAPFDYVIRTGAKSPYLSHFADTYGVHEEQFHTEYFPDYTVEMFADDVLNDYPCRRQRRGA